jgi:hypothetical protein
LTILLTVASASLWLWALTGSFKGCSSDQVPNEWLKQTAATLDATVDLGLTIATTLVGAGGALLVGFKGVTAQLKPTDKLLLLWAIIFFGQSAIAGVIWKLRLANSWFNRCLDFLAEPLMQNLFLASLWFFIAGLVVTLLWVAACVVAAAQNEK